MIKKLFINTLAAGLLAFSGQRALAQDGQTYKHAIGGRFGVANGITFKNFITDANAIDVIMNFRSNHEYSTFRLMALYEIHREFPSVEGLRWYYGAGAGVGTYKDKIVYPDGREGSNEFALSAEGVVGLDYKIKNAPINFGLDWKPSLNLAPDANLKFDGFGFSVRFTF
ncbi:hypothetical protein SAMN05216436_10545 [bacterium A37T11]|nr:hypothetical protein SAMN05216436_10545 [bacterium A37T11]